MDMDDLVFAANDDRFNISFHVRTDEAPEFVYVNEKNVKHGDVIEIKLSNGKVLHYRLNIQRDSYGNPTLYLEIP